MPRFGEQLLYIAGRPVAATSGTLFESINPANGEVLARVHSAGRDDVEQAVTSARQGQQVWAAMGPFERARILRRAVDILRERNDELALLETLDTGKPLSETRSVDIVTGADVLEYYAGLIPAIEWLAQNFTQRTGVPCELLLDEHAELVEPYATAAFRIVQESLANVGKHAQAQSVDVHVRIIDDELLLIVEDDGVGFATDDTRKPNSLGLLGLRERAYLLKGRVDIRTAPGEGTRIEVRMPLMPQDGREIS